MAVRTSRKIDPVGKNLVKYFRKTESNDCKEYTLYTKGNKSYGNAQNNGHGKHDENAHDVGNARFTQKISDYICSQPRKARRAERRQPRVSQQIRKTEAHYRIDKHRRNSAHCRRLGKSRSPA